MDGVDLPIIVSMGVAGLFGAFTYAMIAPERKSLFRSISSILVGFSASLFLTPLVCDWYAGLTSNHAKHAAAFVIGLVGNPVCRAILSETSKQIAGEVADAFGRFFNRQKNGGSPSPPTKRQRPDSDPPV